jgi:putative hydrolase of the HAD superfamily
VGTVSDIGLSLFVVTGSGRGWYESAVRADGTRGLLVDFGGVLTSNIWIAFDAFCRREGLAAGAVLELFRSDGEVLALLRELERGKLADDEFEERFADKLGVAPDGLIGRLFAGLEPDRRMIGAVQAAGAAGVRTGLISNSWGEGIYDRAPLELFDATVISGDVGLHKPEPEIYRLATERIGVPAERCVFVDDLRENVAGAEAVGMTAILHRDAERTVAELEELLGVELGARDDGQGA